ncbi:MAG: hypothetical protein DWQ58_19395 [Microcystis aeruginosa TA09]|uniref:hypothetical protein n=1 Tax=Microcystis TaxID=1125 RepID=UPI000E38A15F|nr:MULTISPECIES: hypothetical protein [Microcystis]REJ47463.1 MAG: hypothetical protein DWQ58_19395 [Microcystis aeruginosa TA09]UZO77949.1 hypothetical protein M8120_08700 [Microcystis aeruginosa str. Chao 1910]
MKDEIIAIYCLCDDILKAMNHQEDSQQQISDAEVMTTAIVATLYDSGNFEKGRKAMSQPQYIPSDQKMNKGFKTYLKSWQNVSINNLKLKKLITWEK